MSTNEKQLFLGVFLNEADLVAATRDSRGAGFRIHDAFTPYAVHGLPEAMGLSPSRLPWACFAFALTGLTLAWSGQYWMSAVDWPLNVGGKPFNSLPAFLPAMFELMVLLAGVGTVVALFLRTGLRPGREAWLAHARATDDRFVLAIEVDASGVDERELAELWGRRNLHESLTMPARAGRAR